MRAWLAGSPVVVMCGHGERAMSAVKKYLLAWMCLQLPVLAHAEPPRPASVAAPVPEAERYGWRTGIVPRLESLYG